jgi:hypothetical protein
VFFYVSKNRIIIKRENAAFGNAPKKSRQFAQIAFAKFSFCFQSFFRPLCGFDYAINHSFPFGTGLPDFSWSKHTKMGKCQMTTNYTKRSYNITPFYIPRPSILYPHWDFWLGTICSLRKRTPFLHS